MGRAECVGDCRSILRASSQRSWLNYDPDALLPSPFDVFLLSGACPRITWEVADRDSRQVDLCYVVGCGRSGSTVFGDILSHYESALFLNEPRQLWIPLLPSMDVWSVEAPGRQGRLHFTADDAMKESVLVDEASEVAPLAKVVCGAYQDLAAMVPLRGDCEGEEKPRLVLIEKFPEHAFRMEFLSRICCKGLGEGRCKFVHLIRDGIAVARSVACFGNSASWYGVKGDFKWKQLLACMSILPLALNDAFKKYLEASKLEVRLFARGLVEWALSVEAVRTASACLGSQNAFLEVRYEDLNSSPSDVLSSFEEFMGLMCSEEARRFAADTLRMKEPKPLSDSETKVLKALHGSKIETFLKEFGWQLWDE